MQTLETLRRRIAGAQDMQSVVKTMKALAAVNIRQFESAVRSLADYNRTLRLAFRILFRQRTPVQESPLEPAGGGLSELPLQSANLPSSGSSHKAPLEPAGGGPSELPLQASKHASSGSSGHRPKVGQAPLEPRQLGAIVFGSDQGMCGQFNDEIAAYALRFLHSATAENRLVMAVGARVAGRLEEAGVEIDEFFSLPGSLSAITPLVQTLLPRIQSWESERGVRNVFLFYNQRTSASSFRSRHLQLLPAESWLAPSRRGQRSRVPHRGRTGSAIKSPRNEPPRAHEIDTGENHEQPFRTLPLYTMNWGRLFSALIRQYLFVTLFSACAESMASENASRIASMQAAEQNIQDRLAEFQSRYHQMRQTAITEELLDVVSGFEALTETSDHGR